VNPDYKIRKFYLLKFYILINLDKFVGVNFFPEVIVWETTSFA
jgi:hypothetical protein